MNGHPTHFLGVGAALSRSILMTFTQRKQSPGRPRALRTDLSFVPHRQQGRQIARGSDRRSVNPPNHGRRYTSNQGSDAPYFVHNCVRWNSVRTWSWDQRYYRESTNVHLKSSKKDRVPFPEYGIQSRSTCCGVSLSW